VKKILFAVLFVAAAVPAGAQSLRGSHASVQKMYSRAVMNDLEFFRTSKSVYESVRDGELVMLSITEDMTLDGVSYPFVLQRTRDFVNIFAKKYHDACGERLVVTSAARPRNRQPRNASPESVHPTGMAVDFRKPSGNCLTFMRGELLALEKLGTIEATEEHIPVHFHVAVLQRVKPPTRAVAEATAANPAPAAAAVTASVASATVTDSAGGTVEVDRKPAAKSGTYTVRKGDNLWTIARRFGLTVSRLKQLNGLKSSALQPGQKLKTG
jgi:hypothetical protein